MNKIEEMIQWSQETMDENSRKIMEDRLWLEKMEELQNLDAQISIFKDERIKMQRQKKKLPFHIKRQCDEELDKTFEVIDYAIKCCEKQRENLKDEMSNKFYIPERLFIHDGVFTASDVLATAIIKSLYERHSDEIFKIERVDKLPAVLPSKSLAIGIGSGRYDNHRKQNNIAYRNDSNPYGTAGLVFKDFGHQLFEHEIPKTFAADIMQIDDEANNVSGHEHHIISDIVSNMYPHLDSYKDMDEAFMEAVDLVQYHYVEPYIIYGYLPETEQQYLNSRYEDLHMDYEKSVERAREMIEKMKDDQPENVANGFVILPEANLPMEGLCEDPNIKFVIAPFGPEAFCIQTVPTSPNSSEPRYPLPENWLAQNPLELLSNKTEDLLMDNSDIYLLYKPNGMSSISQDRDFAIFETKEYAIEAVQDVIRAYEQQKENILKSIEKGSSLEDVPKEFQNDIDVVITAVQNNPEELQFAPNFLKENAEVLRAVQTANEPDDPGKKNRTVLNFDR